MKVRTYTTAVVRDDLASARTKKFSMEAIWNPDGTFNADESRFLLIVEVLDENGIPIKDELIRRTLAWSELPTAAKDEIKAVALRCLAHPDVPVGTDADPTEA